MRVTVGIPFHNAERTLAHAIRSVFTQTFQDWELLLVDDASTDRSLAIAREVQDSRVRVHSDGLRRGLATRLNQIADLAYGEFLARMDADDIMHPERLADQLEVLQGPTPADLVASAAYMLNDEDAPVGVRGAEGADLRLSVVLRRSPFVHPTVIAKTAWFRANRYDPAYPRAEDHELWCRTCQHLKAVHLLRPLLFYRQPSLAAAAKFSQTYATDRKIIRAYGRPIGRLQAARLITASYCKTWVRSGAALVGRSVPVLHDRRLTPAEQAVAARDLRSILVTPVPGFDLKSRGTDAFFAK
jgi:glycosyltransferase involved in cell wall biosynthesis